MQYWFAFSYNTKYENSQTWTYEQWLPACKDHQIWSPV
jgi:hypothetical protein